MRELADWREDRYAAVAAWSLREALLAYAERLRREARESYARDCDRYMHGRQVTAEPKLPDILAIDDAPI